MCLAMPYWSSLVLSVPLYSYLNMLFFSSHLYMLSLSPFYCFGLHCTPLGEVVTVLTLSKSNMNMNMNMCWYSADGGGCGGCGWCVCPPACLLWRTPTTFGLVEMSVERSARRQQPRHYPGWAGHVENLVIWYGPAMWKFGQTMGQRKGDGAILFCQSFMTCIRLDYVYVHDV